MIVGIPFINERAAKIVAHILQWEIRYFVNDPELGLRQSYASNRVLPPLDTKGIIEAPPEYWVHSGNDSIHSGDTVVMSNCSNYVTDVTRTSNPLFCYGVLRNDGREGRAASRWCDVDWSNDSENSYPLEVDYPCLIKIPSLSNQADNGYLRINYHSLHRGGAA